MGTRVIPVMTRTWFGFGREKPMDNFCKIEFTCDACGYQEDGTLSAYVGAWINPRWLRRNLPGGKAETFCCHECARKGRKKGKKK